MKLTNVIFLVEILVFIEYGIHMEVGWLRVQLEVGLHLTRLTNLKVMFASIAYRPGILYFLWDFNFYSIRYI